MKKLNKSLPLILSLALALLSMISLLPQFFARVDAESNNRGVVFSLLYTEAKNRLDPDSLSQYLESAKDAGVTSVTVSEDTMNVLIARGDVVGLQLHDIRHKYDDETVGIEAAVDAIGGVGYNSHIIIAKREDAALRLRRWLPLYYDESDYADLGDIDGMAVFVFYDGNRPTYDIPVGYDESQLADARDHGFDITITMRAGSHANVGYIAAADELIERYGVKYFNVRRDSYSSDADENADENVRLICDMIRRHKMQLVVTENQSQLSNEACVGYDKIFDAADGRVLRSYETYDESQADPTGYMFRYYQYINSVVDRNIRFITVTEVSTGGKTAVELSRDTLQAVSLANQKLTSLGYDTSGADTDLGSYERMAATPALAAAFASSAVCAAVIAIFGLTDFRWFIAAAAVTAASFGVSFFMPESLLRLYPTCVALAIPSLAVALGLLAIKRLRDGLSTIPLAAASVLTILAVEAAGGVVMASLLSGLDYYVNNEIFRGIKLTLYAPLLLAAAAYYIMFVHRKGSFTDDVKSLLGARIRISWALAAMIVGVVSVIYIVRSGNVSSISSLEASMREFITDHFAARPRTKEFLVAYPCLALFVWYAKNTKTMLPPWFFAIGAAILPASVTNTFCHVFTDASIQFGRLGVGLLLGIFTAAFASALNLLFVRIIKKRFGVEL